MTQVTNSVSNTAAHAATALRDVAGSTAHTLSGLMGDAHDRLEHLHLPAVHSLPTMRRRPSRGRMVAPWVAAVVVIAAAAAYVRSRARASQASTLRVADDGARIHAA